MRQGQRTDHKYPIILRYIDDNDPISIDALHKYLKHYFKITRQTSGSRIIAKLVSKHNLYRNHTHISRKPLNDQ